MSRNTSSNVAEMECDNGGGIESKGEREGEGKEGEEEATPTSSSKNKKKKKKKKSAAKTKKANNTAIDASSTNGNGPVSNPGASASQAGFSPLSRYPPPKCCPPDRCTGISPNYGAWAELDGLLYETCLAGFKCMFLLSRSLLSRLTLISVTDELIGALPAPLFHLREKLAKSYLLSGGRMCLDSGEPKSMDEFLRLAEERGAWSTANHPEVQAWAQRVLAISLQKLVDVLVSCPSILLSLRIRLTLPSLRVRS